MKRLHLLAASAIAITIAAPAHAQDGDAAAVREELAAMRAQMKAMAQQIDSLQQQLTTAEATAVAASEAAAAATEAATSAGDTSIAFKGAPEIKGKGGWSFKPRGRLQYDAGFVSAPDSTGSPDGFGNEVRRARLGVQGDMPGGFGYKFELDFDGTEVAITDAILTYEANDLGVTIGQHNNFQGLEELTSSLSISHMERAAFTDAFGFERRVGASLSYGSGDVLVEGGLFTDSIDSLSNKNWGGRRPCGLHAQNGEDPVPSWRFGSFRRSGNRLHRPVPSTTGSAFHR
ncbi:porin [Altererythrobacter sp.]|nr:porin [Altererythrobacter sp.]